MTQHTQDHRTFKPTRSAFSLLLAVVLLAVLLQPCVLAGSWAGMADPVTGAMSIAEAGQGHASGCCDQDRSDGCNSASGQACFESEHMAGVDSTAATEEKTSFKQLELPAMDTLALVSNQFVPKTVPFYSPPDSIFSTPSIIVLFRAYLN